MKKDQVTFVTHFELPIKGLKGVKTKVFLLLFESVQTVTLEFGFGLKCKKNPQNFLRL